MRLRDEETERFSSLSLIVPQSLRLIVFYDGLKIKVVIKFEVMGQIIIDIPVNKNLYYEIANAGELRELMRVLDKFRALENPELTEEDLEDIRYAYEMLEHGEFVLWEDAKKTLT